MTDGIQRKVGMPVNTIVIQGLTSLGSHFMLVTIIVSIEINLVGNIKELLANVIRKNKVILFIIQLSKTLAGSEDNLVVLMDQITISVLSSLGFQPFHIIQAGLLQGHHFLDKFLCLLTQRKLCLSLGVTDKMLTAPFITSDITTVTPGTSISSFTHFLKAD